MSLAKFLGFMPADYRFSWSEKISAPAKATVAQSLIRLLGVAGIGTSRCFRRTGTTVRLGKDWMVVRDGPNLNVVPYSAVTAVREELDRSSKKGESRRIVVEFAGSAAAASSVRFVPARAGSWGVADSGGPHPLCQVIREWAAKPREPAPPGGLAVPRDLDPDEPGSGHMRHLGGSWPDLRVLR